MSLSKSQTASTVRPEWQDAKRIVVKIGSALLTDRDTGRLNAKWLATLIDDVADLTRAGKQVVLVSSGAIALGRHILKLPKGALELDQSQAAAAVGQISLAHAYQNEFARHGLSAAQVLLTLGDTEERRRYLNARCTIETLLTYRAIPVVNENDTVATSEIRYGDNDRLSARVASMISADCLVLLSDIDGLYTAPPLHDATAKRLDEVREITREIEAMAGDAGTELSKGGMITKIEAAKIARAAGTHMVITLGSRLNPLKALATQAAATWFIAPTNPVTARKRWISGQLEARGTISIDAGAQAALGRGKSLLPAGVCAIKGEFGRGDVVKIHSLDGHELGRGLIAYNHQDAALIIGKKSTETAALLGYPGRTELIHRDDMVLHKK